MTGQEPGGQPELRFEATVHAPDRDIDLAAIDALDLDRVPDPEGGVRMLLGQQDMARLLAEGYEVRLRAAAPVAPLDPALVADDADVRAWFDEATRGDR
jgi:hypothetical protein